MIIERSLLSWNESLLAYYTLLFGIVSVLYTLLAEEQESRQESFVSKTKRIPQPLMMSLKAVPAFVSCLFVFSSSNMLNGLSLLLISVFVFYMLGDVAIEIKFILGMVFFSIAHVVLMTIYLVLVSGYEITLFTAMGGLVTFSFLSIYGGALVRYLNRSPTGLGKYELPVVFYSILLVVMATASLFFYISAQIAIALLVSAGTVLFVLSDTLVAIREFHHSYNHSEIATKATYFPAIYLISLLSLIL